MNLKNLFKNILLASHPIGSIFITTDGDFDPHEKWGGTWELLEDSFLVGAGNTYTLGATGGEATHTLTENEMPRHLHNWAYANASGSGNNSGISYVQQKDKVWAVNGTTEGAQYQDIAFTGGSQAHNNLPPYTAVNMWLRIA